MIRCSATARRTGVIKLRELIVILDLHKQGLRISAIAERTGLDRKTVRKYQPNVPALCDRTYRAAGVPSSSTDTTVIQ